MSLTEQNLDEPRLYTEEGLAARVAALSEPVAKSLGFRLVRVKQSGTTLQVMAERADGTFTIDDCEKLSRTLSPVLDAEDIMAGSYNLEVSSPGIDRPLARITDFAGHVGDEIKIEFTQMIDGRKRARGVIETAAEKEFTLKVDNQLLSVPFAAVAEAKLVLNDKLIRQAQGKAKSDLSDGAAYDGAQYDDVTMSEDRRNSHGR